MQTPNFELKINGMDAKSLMTNINDLAAQLGITSVSPQMELPVQEEPKEEVKEEKPKKTTKKKASTKKKKEEPKVEEAPVEEVKAETFTKEDISSACQKLAEKHGLVKAKELLESFGAKRVSDVPEAKYPEFMQAASEAM